VNLLVSLEDRKSGKSLALVVVAGVKIAAPRFTRRPFGSALKVLDGLIMSALNKSELIV
jgi:hypothetical protein